MLSINKHYPSTNHHTLAPCWATESEANHRPPEWGEGQGHCYGWQLQRQAGQGEKRSQGQGALPGLLCSELTEGEALDCGPRLANTEQVALAEACQDELLRTHSKSPPRRSQSTFHSSFWATVSQHASHTMTDVRPDDSNVETGQTAVATRTWRLPGQAGTVTHIYTHFFPCNLYTDTEVEKQV